MPGRSEHSKAQRRAHEREKYRSDPKRRASAKSRAKDQRQKQRALKQLADRYADNPHLLALDELTAVLASMRGK